MAGEGAWVGAYQDLAALGGVDGGEGGELAEAAAAVADDEADGAAPPEAGGGGRVLGRDVEVLLQIPLHARCPAAAALHARSFRSPLASLLALALGLGLGLVSSKKRIAEIGRAHV